jgi:hypothetical protein
MSTRFCASWLTTVACLLAGCASGPETYEPTVADYEGPWDVEVHRSMVHGFWIGFGPYRSNWTNMYLSKGRPAAEVGITQVNYESKKEPFAAELVNAHGSPIYISFGLKPAEKTIDLGLFDVPVGNRETAGIIATEGHPIAEFTRRFEKEGKLGLSEKRIETLTIGDVRLTVCNCEKESGNALLGALDMSWRLQYLDESGQEVAWVSLQSGKRVWISNSLSRDVQSAIAIHAADLVIRKIFLEQQQNQSTNAINSARLANSLRAG